MAPQLFHSVEDLHRFLKGQTVQVASQFGFDTHQDGEDGQTFYGKHGSDEVIRIYRDGTWSFERGGEEEMTGESALMLGYYLSGNQELFNEVFKE